MKYRLSNHALEEMTRRRIPHVFVELVLNQPQQVILEREGRKVYQSKLDFGQGKTHILRIIIDENTEPYTIITVYRTSKIEKYWRQS